VGPGKPPARSEADGLRERLNAAANPQSGTGIKPGETGPMKDWGVAEELRPVAMTEPVNKGRLAPEGVPELAAGKLPRAVAGPNSTAGPGA
jgi:hypothetical protein